MNFLRHFALQEERNLMTARVSMLLKSRASPGMLPFSLCNNKRLAIRHKNRPLFLTTLSIPSYDIGKKVGLSSYQHLLLQRKEISKQSDYGFLVRAVGAVERDVMEVRQIKRISVCL